MPHIVFSVITLSISCGYIAEDCQIRIWKKVDFYGQIRFSFALTECIFLLRLFAVLEVFQMAVLIGSNTFSNVAAPVMIDDRCFFLEDNGVGMDLWTVVTRFGDGLILEVLRNRPILNPLTQVTSNPTGIITISDRERNMFRHKIRPGRRNSSIFGVIDGEESEIIVRDGYIKAAGVKLQKNKLSGSEVGVMVRGSSVSISGPLPPEFRRLMR